MTVAMAIKVMYKAAGFSQVRLSLALGKSKKHIESLLPTCENTRLSVLLPIADACNYDLLVRERIFGEEYLLPPPVEDTSMEIGKAIKVMMTMSGNTYRGLSSKLGCSSVGVLTRAISNNGVTISKLIRIANACGFDVILRERLVGDEIKLTEEQKDE